jgi:hypothetical protein
MSQQQMGSGYWDRDWYQKEYMEGERRHSPYGHGRPV